MPGLISPWGWWSMKNRQQLGIQEGSKSSCCYSCSQKETAWMATSDNYMKAEKILFADFSHCDVSTLSATSLAPATYLCMGIGQHGSSPGWSCWKGECRLLKQENYFPTFPSSFSNTATNQKISHSGLCTTTWERRENCGGGLLMLPMFPLGEGAKAFGRELRC